MTAISLNGMGKSAFIHMRSLKLSFFTKALLFNTSWDKPNIQSNFFSINAHEL